MNARPTRVGQSAIARAAGVSRVAVSYALSNRPGVSEATREHVREIARRLGYQPDPKTSAWMARVRESRPGRTMPLAWLNHHKSERDAWHQHKFLTPYREGAEKRAGELGYHLDDIWTSEPGMTPSKLSRIIYQRGIEGVIATLYVQRLDFPLKKHATVSLDGNLESPLLPRVVTDIDFNVFLAFGKLKELGYRRIGFCLPSRMSDRVHFTLRPLIHSLVAGLAPSEQIPPLFYDWKNARDGQSAKRQVIAWLKNTRPEVVICHSNLMLEWCAEAGISVPHEMGVAHLATDDDVPDWAGICSNRRHIGATAIEWVIALIVNRDFGIPSRAPTLLIRGDWHAGRTLLSC